MGCTNNALAFLLLRMQLPSTHRSNVDYGLWPMDWTILPMDWTVAYGLDWGLWTGLWTMDWTVDWALSLQLAETSLDTSFMKKSL